MWFWSCIEIKCAILYVKILFFLFFSHNFKISRNTFTVSDHEQHTDPLTLQGCQILIEIIAILSQKGYHLQKEPTFSIKSCQYVLSSVTLINCLIVFIINSKIFSLFALRLTLKASEMFCPPDDVENSRSCATRHLNRPSGYPATHSARLTRVSRDVCEAQQITESVIG